MASRAGNRKSPPVFVFTFAGGLWGFLYSVFSSGIVSVFLQCCKIRHNPCYLGNLRDFRVLGTAMYLVHRCCDDEALDAVLGEDVVVAAAEGFFECGGQTLFGNGALIVFCGHARQRCLIGMNVQLFFPDKFGTDGVCLLLEGFLICCQKFHRRLVVQAADFAFDKAATELEYQKEMEEIEEVIQRSILYRKKDTDFQIGIGKSVEGYQRLKESYYEASQAIKYIEIIRLVTGDKNKSVVHYSNLGFFQIFGKVDDMTELERCIPETLKKLYLYDDEHKGELITTLQMYLRNNQSIKKTAGAMFVHYRTISYRLEKIKQISGINFDNANEVLAVSNGLIIYKMLKEIE